MATIWGCHIGQPQIRPRRSQLRSQSRRPGTLGQRYGPPSDSSKIAAQVVAQRSRSRAGKSPASKADIAYQARSSAVSHEALHCSVVVTSPNTGFGRYPARQPAARSLSPVTQPKTQKGRCSLPATDEQSSRNRRAHGSGADAGLGTGGVTRASLAPGGSVVPQASVRQRPQKPANRELRRGWHDLARSRCMSAQSAGTVPACADGTPLTAAVES
jgi:hypothetical protein